MIIIILIDVMLFYYVHSINNYGLNDNSAILIKLII